MAQCITLTLLEGGLGRGNFGSLQGWADPENLERWDLIEAKANILNKKLKSYTVQLKSYSSYIEWLLTCVCVCANHSKQSGLLGFGPPTFSTNSSKFIGTFKGGTIPETGKKMSDDWLLITFYNCSVKIFFCSSCSLIYMLYKWFGHMCSIRQLAIHTVLVIVIPSCYLLTKYVYRLSFYIIVKHIDQGTIWA